MPTNPNDPAAHAAATPEPPTPTQPTVWAVGIGPGNPAFLTHRATDLLETADVIVGFQTVIDHITPHTTADLLPCTYDTEPNTLATFADRTATGDTGCAVFMGDPNVSGYQFLGKLEATLDHPVRVVPGISAIQIAASRARTPLEATTVVTLHKRGSLHADLDRLTTAVHNRHLLVLPRPYDWMPEHIAAHLIDHNAPPAREALVLEHLTLPEETITTTTLGDLADDTIGTTADDTAYSDLTVLAVRHPQ